MTRPPDPPAGGRGVAALTGLVLVGAAVSVSLGVYGRQHTPTYQPIWTLGFPSLLDMKAWLTTTAAVLGVVQLVTALRMYGRFGSGDPSRLVVLGHRSTGVLAVLVTVPVAYQCLWSLGFATYDSRVVVHSLLGCAFYGVFVTKMLALRLPRLPGWALPVLGGLLFTVLVGLWWTSAWWFFRQPSPHY